MDYARLAARHFGLDHQTYYVTPDDVVDSVPRIAAAYDQPFGNASAVPTYFCARLAREHGVGLLLAGDGGDELFGGNTRYAKQQQFAYYERVPQWFRRGLIEPAVSRFPPAAPMLLRKARSYVEQASMPMPDRYESYNLLQRIGPASVFAPDFLSTIDDIAPVDRQRSVYRDTQCAHAHQPHAGVRFPVHARGQRSAQGDANVRARRRRRGVPDARRRRGGVFRAHWPPR